MKALIVVLVLVVVAGCSTPLPSSTAGLSRSAAVPVPVRTKPALEQVVVQAVHGHVRYWDGRLWTAMRPNMAMANAVQISPGADSSIDLMGGHSVSMRLITDHLQNVKAYLVSRAQPVSVTAVEQALDSKSMPGVVLPPGGGVAVAISADGKVQMLCGEMMLRGDGRMYVLRDGQYFDANTDEVGKEILAKSGQAGSASRGQASTEMASTPRTLLFASGLESARRMWPAGQ